MSENRILIGERLLRLADVEKMVALGRSTIYRRMSDGTFPRPVSLGPNVVRWRASAIEQWIEGLPETGGGS